MKTAKNGHLDSFAYLPLDQTAAHTHTCVALNRSEAWISTIDLGQRSMGRQGVADEFKGWAPQLRALITDGESVPVIRPSYALPITHSWERVPGVTMVGDAAHLMSPFAGEGAKLAIYDGAELGKAICASPDDVEAALTDYEQALLPRRASVANQGTFALPLRGIHHKSPNRRAGSCRCRYTA